MVLRCGSIILMTLAVVQVFGKNHALYESIFDFLHINKTENGTIIKPGQFPGIEGHNVTESNLNLFFDENLERIKQMIYEKNLDPLEMPDRFVVLPDSKPKALLHLRNGWVQQLATIKRTGDIFARYHGNKLTVEFDLGWDRVDMNNAYTLRSLLYIREGNFHGYFKDIRIAAQGSINLDDYKMDLQFFKVVNAEDFCLELTGHLSDYIINLITRTVSTLAKDKVIREIEYHFAKGIQEKIKEINQLMPNPLLQ